MKKMNLIIGIALLFLVGAVYSHDTNPITKESDTTKTVKEADTTKTAKKSTESTAKEKKMPEWTTNESGLKWRDIEVGEGTVAEMGTTVDCHYTLWLTDSTGEKGTFVQTSKEGNPFRCTVGVRLIQGWSEGMVGMKEGGVRELIVPPAIGYGNKAMGDMIPGNSTLYFEIVYVKEIKK